MYNYKQISINFNLDNEKEYKMYLFLKNKRGVNALLKDLIEKYMEGNNGFNN